MGGLRGEGWGLHDLVERVWASKELGASISC